MATMSQFQVNAYLAKQRSKGAGLVGGKSESQVKDEAQIHEQIIGEVKRRGWIAFHGSMAHRTFRTPGEPDFVILGDGGAVFLVEVKTSTGKLSIDQQAIHAWARKLGHTVHVVRSLEEFIQIL